MKMKSMAGMLLPLLVTLAAGIGRGADSQQTAVTQNSGEVTIGKSLFVTCATAAYGPLGQKYPFDAVTYGKVRGYCPVTAEDSKLVVYTRVLDKNFFRLAAALDSVVAKHKQFAGALVIVMDAKGAQRGGYTVEEVQQRRAEIRQLATQHNIKHLSFFLSAPNADSVMPRLGLTDGSNLLLASLVESDQSGKRAVVQWLTRLDTAKLDAKILREVTASLEMTMNNK